MRQIFKRMNKDSAIAIVFLVILFLIPTATLCGITSSDDAVMAEAEKVLSNNGTSAETTPDINTDAADFYQTDEDTNMSLDEVTAENMDGKTGAGQPLFARIQNMVNAFTESLFLRPLFIEGNTKITAILTGGTYMESTQVLLGKDNWLFYKTQNDGYPIYDYMGINHFSQ